MRAGAGQDDGAGAAAAGAPGGARQRALTPDEDRAARALAAVGGASVKGSSEARPFFTFLLKAQLEPLCPCNHSNHSHFRST